MNSIRHEDINGIPALAFDTGLDAKAFAQTKSAALITLPGWSVGPDGRVALWKIEGVVERRGRMVIWGRDFPGTPLSEILPDRPQQNGNDPTQDDALDALRRWICARLALAETKSVDVPPLPYPIGAFIGADGSILFPPEPLVRQAVEAESADLWRTGAERWAHPDLAGLGGVLFTAAALAYRIFAGTPPFLSENRDILRQDIREHVFFPAGFAAPGLDPALAGMITAALETKPSDTGVLPALTALRDRLGPPESAQTAAYVHALTAEEQAKLAADLERFRKNQRLRVKTKRFVARNAAILGISAAALIAVGLSVHSFAVAKAGRPTTKGMAPAEVLETYYTAIGNLDHSLMEACVAGKAGKGDVEMVVNYFVLSKVRQAYEMGAPAVISAQKWLDAGSPSLEAQGIMVFGVSGLRLQPVDQDESDGEVSFRARYFLWHPDSESDAPQTPGPRHTALTDTVRLSMQKGLWHITQIERRVNE